MSDIHLRTLHLGSGIAGREKLGQTVLDTTWKRTSHFAVFQKRIF